jgi:hypothetical protein
VFGFVRPSSVHQARYRLATLWPQASVLRLAQGLFSQCGRRPVAVWAARIPDANGVASAGGVRAPASLPLRPDGRRNDVSWHGQPDGWFLLRRSGGRRLGLRLEFRAQRPQTAARARSSFGRRIGGERVRDTRGTKWNCAGGRDAVAERGCPARNIAQGMSVNATLCARQGTALPALGKFPHEARRRYGHGYVYLTEDDYEDRLYRFRPDVWGNLARVLEARRCNPNGHESRGSAVRPDRPYRERTRRRSRAARGLFADGIVYFCTTRIIACGHTTSRPGRSK